MDTETSRTIEILRSSLVDCVNCLKVEQEKLNLLSLAVKSLIEALQSRDSGLFHKYEEAQHSMGALDWQALATLSNPSIDAVLEKLKAIPKAN